MITEVSRFPKKNFLKKEEDSLRYLGVTKDRKETIVL